MAERAERERRDSHVAERDPDLVPTVRPIPAPLFIAVDVRSTSQSQLVDGTSDDVELFYATHLLLPMGTLVDVELTLGDSARPVRAQGRIAWLRYGSLDQARGVGIAFEDLSGEDLSEIRAFRTTTPR